MLKIRRPLVHQVHRDAWVEVDLGNIEHNIYEFEKIIPKHTKILAVVKADAYGHGAAMCASTLIASGVDMFGVSSVDEGIQLREAGAQIPILVLGTTPDWAFASAVENNLTLALYSDEHLQVCKDLYDKHGLKAQVHVKVNTGMNRIGVDSSKAVEFISHLKKCDFVSLKGVFTHFACAESTQETAKQVKRWNKIYESFAPCEDLMFHCSNTAATIAFDLKFDMARVGIGIYGLMPDLPEGDYKIPQLRQSMSLKGRIVNVFEIDKDQGVSYGFTFVSKEKTKIATIPVGYADGVLRGLSNKIYGIINGQKVRQIGNITMDQMMFDVTDVDVKKGDIITLLGDGISVDEWASILGTINYEITCLLKARLPRIYTRSKV